MDLENLIPKAVRQRIKKEVRAMVPEPLAPKLTYFTHCDQASHYVLEKPQRSGELPVPPQPMWHGYGKTPEEHLASGKRDVSKMLEILGPSGLEGERVLDFGCAAGRMLRHLVDTGASELWGTDVSARLIYWARQNLSPPMRFATTTTVPHLPFEDRYFGLIYAGSVFTHIEDLAEAWLLELRRVLTPQGRLYLTIHDEHTVQLFDTAAADNWLTKMLREDDFYTRYKHEHAMLVIGRGLVSQVFYRCSYFMETLKMLGFEVLSATPQAYGYQTAILATRI